MTEPTRTTAPAQYLTREQVHALIDAANPGRDRLFIRVAWETGARVSELVALRCVDVLTLEGDGREFVYLGGPKAARAVYVSGSLMGDLCEFIRGDHWLPQNLIFGFTRYTAFRMVRDTARRAGLVLEGGRDITPDALRAAFTMNLILQDVPLSVVQELVGQASLKGVSAHAKTDPARVREYLRKVEF